MMTVVTMASGRAPALCSHSGASAFPRRGCSDCSSNHRRCSEESFARSRDSANVSWGECRATLRASGGARTGTQPSCGASLPSFPGLLTWVPETKS